MGIPFFGIASSGNPLCGSSFLVLRQPVRLHHLPARNGYGPFIPVFSRRIVGYTYVALSTVLTGLVGFSVWLHHMFTIGMSDLTMSFFREGSMTIPLFTTVTVFAWVAAVWKGGPVPTTAMFYALGSIAQLVIGGLSGAVTGIIPVDWQTHNSY